jgi:hypothetical protein
LCLDQHMSSVIRILAFAFLSFVKATLPRCHGI